MIKITCENCQKPLSIDETKLPNQRVSFPCPSCKAKLSIDRREHEGGGAAAAPPAAAPQSFDTSHSEPLDHASTDDDHDHLGEKAMIVGVDNPAVRQAAKTINLNPVHFGAVDAARDYLSREYPPVIFICPQQLTPPPLADFGPVLSLMPSDRRRSYFILVADNLRTFDGNAAFLYGTNLVVATKDLPSFGKIYREAYAFHQKLYTSMKAAGAEVM
jgi:hypothetical protein